MAAQLYSNTKLAESLFEVLSEMVQGGELQEDLAMATLAQSFLGALDQEVTAKADIKGNLRTYKYYDNVWQFLLKDISFRLNPTGQGSARKAPEIKADVIKLVCVEYKLATEHMEKK